MCGGGGGGVESLVHVVGKCRQREDLFCSNVLTTWSFNCIITRSTQKRYIAVGPNSTES